MPDLVLLAALVLGPGELLWGCMSTDAGLGEPAGRTEPDALPVDAEQPAESPLSKVQNDMSSEQVREIMGSPTGQSSYPTAKTYNRVGDDSGNRVVYMYKGQGRVLFAVPKYGGDMRVLRVDYDPAEDGN